MAKMVSVILVRHNGVLELAHTIVQTVYVPTSAQRSFTDQGVGTGPHDDHSRVQTNLRLGCVFAADHVRSRNGIMLIGL